MLRSRIAGLLSGTVLVLGNVVSVTVAPMAHADPLDDVRGAVNAARSQSTCPPLNYSIALEGEAQAYAHNKLPGVPPTGQYNGKFYRASGSSDPQSRATRLAIEQAATHIKDCKYKDYGVGFFRDDDVELDWVGIALGEPTAAAPAPAAPAPAADVQCPAGSTTPTVPAGQQCQAKPKTTCPDGTTVDSGQDCPAPTNAVSVTFDKGFASWTVKVVNSANISGQCTYEATSNNNTPGTSKDFSIGAKGTAKFTVPAPLFGTSYHVVTSCTGNYNGKSVEFGHNEQDV